MRLSYDIILRSRSHKYSISINILEDVTHTRFVMKISWKKQEEKLGIDTSS